MDRLSPLKFRARAAFWAIVASIWIFLWIRTLLTVGIVLEFIFMISDPEQKAPTSDRPRTAGFPSNPGASLGKMATSSAGTTVAGSPE
jgi:hypothetical protein